eukprot:1161551-Pelagomonas_calceolata.AAC.13
MTLEFGPCVGARLKAGCGLIYKSFWQQMAARMMPSSLPWLKTAASAIADHSTASLKGQIMSNI